jgi:hypothetical protein
VVRRTTAAAAVCSGLLQVLSVDSSQMTLRVLLYKGPIQSVGAQAALVEHHVYADINHHAPQGASGGLRGPQGASGGLREPQGASDAARSGGGTFHCTSRCLTAAASHLSNFGGSQHPLLTSMFINSRSTYFLW